MKKGIFGILCIIFIYCCYNLLVVHDTLIQIEHDKPLNVTIQNSASIHTEQNEKCFVTDIILPSGVFYKHAQIEIKSDIPQNVVIKLSGPKVEYKNTYKKYTIDYKNIDINAEKNLPIFKTTSFLRPFNYSLDNLTSTAVNFDYKTDFVLRNMSLIHFISIIVISFIMVWYGVSYLYQHAWHKKIQFFFLACFNTNDFLQLIINGYKNIKKEYKLFFWLNFIVLNVFYLYLNMNFLHGNHDWTHMRLDFIVNDTYIGRYSIALINCLSMHKYVPVLNNVIAFAFLAMTPIFLAKYWNIALTKFNIFALSFLLFFHPALLNILYFYFLSYTYILVPLLFIIGLILSEKKEYKYSIASIGFFLLGLGDYNIGVNSLAVFFIGKMLLEYSNGTSYKQLLKKYCRTICILLISCFIYLLIIISLKYAHIFQEYYNSKLIPLDQFLPRVVTVFVDSFRRFYITHPFIELKYLISLLLLFIPVLIILITNTIKRKNILYLIGSVFIFILLIFGSNIIHL